MSDGNDIWERQDGEPNNWYSRFVIFLQMGPSRSLLSAENEEKVRKGQKKSDVSASGAWRNAAKQWNWRERAEAWDEYRRKQVFVQGNAYDVTRIEKLDKYSQRLETEIDKMLDALPAKIKKPWFNQFLYEKYLQSLEAIAAETGGRVKKQEITGKDGGPLDIVTKWNGGSKAGGEDGES